MDTLLKTSIFDRVEDFCAREKLVSFGHTIIIGLSGGPDSVFLFHFFCHLREKYELTLIAAHLDHGWRSESAQDALFCKKLCEEHEVTYLQEELKNIPLRATGSPEQDARTARRIFFKRVAQEHVADAIALAHHQDDVAENFFIRLIRGAGISGLVGIKARAGNYIRPLLPLRKQEILTYLQEQQRSYRHDSTNNDTDFLRNSVRHTVLPAYEALDSRAHDNLIRCMQQLHSVDTFLEKQAIQRYHQLRADGTLDIQGLLQEDPVLLHRVILCWLIDAQVQFIPTEKFFAEIVRFLQQPGSKRHTITSSWAIEKIKRKARIISEPKP